MRFRNYLSEEKGDIRELVQKNCKDILKEYASGRPFIWRGVKDIGQVEWIEKKSHIRYRHPLDTPKWIHNAMNDLLRKNFGWPVRNGVPTTINPMQASYYGREMVFFPFDPYKYVYFTETSDFYTWLWKKASIIFKVDLEDVALMPEKDVPQDTREKIKKYLEKTVVKEFTDKNYWQSKGEIFFNTKRYYLIDKMIAKEISPRI